jgi:hypothetical protein
MKAIKPEDQNSVTLYVLLTCYIVVVCSLAVLFI